MGRTRGRVMRGGKESRVQTGENKRIGERERERETEEDRTGARKEGKQETEETEER